MDLAILLEHARRRHVTGPSRQLSHFSRLRNLSQLSSSNIRTPLGVDLEAVVAAVVIIRVSGMLAELSPLPDERLLP